MPRKCQYLLINSSDPEMVIKPSRSSTRVFASSNASSNEAHALALTLRSFAAKYNS